MSRFIKISLLALVVVASGFATGCKSTSGCSSCGAKAVLPASPLEAKAEAIKQA